MLPWRWHRGSCTSTSTLSLGTSICPTSGCKNKKRKKGREEGRKEGRKEGRERKRERERERKKKEEAPVPGFQQLSLVNALRLLWFEVTDKRGEATEVAF